VFGGSAVWSSFIFVEMIGEALDLFGSVREAGKSGAL
jgi:hypothetical protein